MCSCPPHPPCPPHCRMNCKYPMLPTSSSTPRSGHCYLTSSRHCFSSSHMTPSPLLRNSSPTSGHLGPPFLLLGLPTPSPTPQLTILQLTANKAPSTACPVLFALGKLRLREELNCVLKLHYAFWVGPCPPPSYSSPCLGGEECLGHTVEQSQAHIPAPATTPHIPGGHPLPTSLWDSAWLAQGYPRGAASTNQVPMGAPELLPLPPPQP